MFATGNAVLLGLAAPVGGAVAGVVLVAIVIIIACYVIRRNKRSEKDMRAFSGNSNANALSNISSQVRMNFEPVQPTIWVPTRFDTNWAVQSQKMVRGWKFWI